MANILNKLLQLALRKIPEDIGALPDAPPDPSKRNLLKGGAALGALGAIPVVKKVGPRIVDELSSQVPSGIKMEADEVANIVQELSPPKTFGKFEDLSLDKELDMAKDYYEFMYKKPITKKKLLETDMAEYLGYFDFGEDATVDAAYKFKGHPRIIDEVGSEFLEDYATEAEIEEFMKMIDKKYFPDFTGGGGMYGGSAGMDLAAKAYQEAFPKRKFDGIYDEQFKEWLESKVGNTKYYKQIKKFGEERFKKKK